MLAVNLKLPHMLLSDAALPIVHALKGKRDVVHLLDFRVYVLVCAVATSMRLVTTKTWTLFTACRFLKVAAHV